MLEIASVSLVCKKRLSDLAEVETGMRTSTPNLRNQSHAKTGDAPQVCWTPTSLLDHVRHGPVCVHLPAEVGARYLEKGD